MAKKITVAMLKSEKELSNEEIQEFITMMGNAAVNISVKDDKITLNDIAPISEVDYDKLAGLGAGILYFMKKVCTPAAWKYLAAEFKNGEIVK